MTTPSGNGPAQGVDGLICPFCDSALRKVALMPELAACPFCGGRAESRNYVIEACVRCVECRATVVRAHGTHDDEGLPQAIAAWNTRLTSPNDQECKKP